MAAGIAFGSPFQFDVPQQQPTGGAMKSNIEADLANVKKSLWNVERHTEQTQSRLEVNNKSGVGYHVQKISNWAANDWALDMIGETLVEIQETLENSAIARHSDSPLEKSLKAIQDQAVYYNEKTLRWHDSQTNRFSPGQSSLNEAAEVNLAQPTEKSNYLEEIAENTKEALTRIPFKEESAEEKMESAALQENRDRDLKAYRKTMKGRWDSFLKWGKESWFVKNWKLVAVGLALLFTPFKYLKPLWIAAKAFWEAPWWGKILAVLTAWFAWTKLKSSIGKAGQFLKKSIATRGVAGTARHGAKRVGRLAKVKSGRLVQGAKAVGGKVVSGAKAVGGATKGIFASLVEKFGKAGKWIAKIGPKLIMGLFTTPVGWAILGGLALGGLFYAYWDEIKGALSDAFGFLKKAVDKVKSIFSGLDIMAGLRAIVPNWILDMIGPSKTEAAEDEPVKPKTPEAAKQGFFESDKAFSERVKKTQPDKDGKAVKVTTTHKKGTTPMGPMESIEVDATSGEVTPRMSKLSATKRLEKMRKRSEGEYGMSRREEKRIRKLLVGEDHVPKKSILDKRKKQKGSKWEGWDASGGHHSAVEMWKQMTDEERKKFARYKPKGADDKATVISTPPRSGFKTKIPQVGVPEKKEPTEGEPSKWLPFGHDKSAFKKQTSFGDKFKNLAKFLWGDKKADEKKEAEPATGADAKSVELAVKTWVKKRKAGGSRRKSADREMNTYIQGLIGNQEEARLALLEKKLKSLDTEKVGGSSRWFKRSGFEKEKDAWVVTTPGIRATKDTKGRKAVKHRKGMGADSSIARASSGEEGAMEVAKERFPDIKFNARQSPDDKMNVMNNVHADRATLGDNQASPTIITSETTNASVQSNPLTYVSGASSARGKPIPTSRSN